MAKEEAAEAAPELSDSERIAQLENRVGFHRILVVVLGALTVILLSSVITGVIVLNDQLSRIEAPGASADGTATGAPAKGGAELAKLEKALEEQTAQLAEIQQTLESQRTIENIRQVQQMAEILRKQESAYRSVMLNLKAGMRDLSRMVPGSRTWLEEYEERMDRSLAGSRERDQRLSGFTQLDGDEAEAAQ